jgi:hypothetical protein
MPTPDEDQIQSIWRSQPILTVTMTPEQLRARAVRFEKETRRRNRLDLVSFAVVALAFGIGTATLQNWLTRTGRCSWPCGL